MASSVISKTYTQSYEVTHRSAVSDPWRCLNDLQQFNHAKLLCCVMYRHCEYERQEFLYLIDNLHINNTNRMPIYKLTTMRTNINF